jgi:hypothetical protein
MIASSTTIPIARVSASRVKLLMEKPMKYMMANVDTIEVGMASPGMIVARRLRRNTKMMTTTSSAAMISVSCASVMECFTKIDWSNAAVIVTPGGSDAWIFGSSSWMASATAMILALDWRITPIATAWVPLKRSALRSSSAASSTRPRSLSLISTPPSLLTTRLENSSGVLSSPRERTVNSRRSDSMRPAGTSTLRDRMACSTSCTVRPCAASCEAEIHTRMEKRRSPKMRACPTPGSVWRRLFTSRSPMSESWRRS